MKIIIYSFEKLKELSYETRVKISKSIYTIARRYGCKKERNVIICPDEESCRKIVDFLKIHDVNYRVINQ